MPIADGEQLNHRSGCGRRPRAQRRTAIVCPDGRASPFSSAAQRASDGLNAQRKANGRAQTLHVRAGWPSPRGEDEKGDQARGDRTVAGRSPHGSASARPTLLPTR